MTTREQKIDVINKVIANKELSFGCRVKHKFIQNQIITIQDYKLNNYIYWIKDWILFDSNSVLFLEEYEIIWHPVMIGDTLDWFSETFFDKTFLRQETLLKLWKEKRKQIEDQSDEIVDFIYNLISKKWEN